MNIKESTKTYIHYCKDAGNEYKRELFLPINNGRRYNTKPNGGLWASPVDAHWGWKDWCEAEDFRDCDEANSFKFRLKPGNKVLTLEKIGDANRVPRIPDQNEFSFFLYLDFEKLLSMGIDAVELVNVGAFYDDLYGWDCESILVMNPDVIEVVKED